MNLDAFGLPPRPPRAYSAKALIWKLSQSVIEAIVIPACYCCGSETHLRQTKNPICSVGVAWVCAECEGMKASIIPRVSLLIVCPAHGERQHLKCKVQEVGWRKTKGGKTTFVMDVTIC